MQPIVLLECLGRLLSDEGWLLRNSKTLELARHRLILQRRDCSLKIGSYLVVKVSSLRSERESK